MVLAGLAQPPQVSRCNKTTPPLDYQASKATRQIKPVGKAAAKRHAGNVEVIMGLNSGVHRIILALEERPEDLDDEGYSASTGDFWNYDFDYIADYKMQPLTLNT